MLANCLAPITKCAYKKAQKQIKEEAFQDGDFTQKAHQYLSSPDVLENTAPSDKCPLGGHKVSMLTHTYPHNPPPEED